MWQRSRGSKLKYPLMMVVVALGLLTGSTAVASAAAQHWYIGTGEAKTKVGSTYISATGTSTKPFRFGYVMALVEDEVECQTATIQGSLVNPAGGGAGTYSNQMVLKGCKSLKFPSCKVLGETAQSLLLGGTAEESTLGTGIKYKGKGASEEFLYFQLKGGPCPLFGEGSYTIAGNVTSVAVPGVDGEYEFVRTKPSGLKIGGNPAWFTGKYKLTSGGQPITIAP